MNGLILGAGCLLTGWEVTVVPEQAGWTEHIRASVVGSCDDLTLVSDPTVSWSGSGAVLRPFDDPKVRLGEAFWHRTADPYLGQIHDRLTVPRLEQGDVLYLTATRTSYTTADWGFEVPGSTSKVVITLDSGDSLQPENGEAWSRKGRAWTCNEPSQGCRARLPTSWVSTPVQRPPEAPQTLSARWLVPDGWFGVHVPSGPEALQLGATTAAAWHATPEALGPQRTTGQAVSQHTLTLVLPTGPIGRVIAPGGGAMRAHTVHLSTHDEPAIAMVALPRAVTESRTEASTHAHVHQTTAGVYVVLPDGEHAAIHWSEPHVGAWLSSADIASVGLTVGTSSQDPLQRDGEAHVLTHVGTTELLSDRTRLEQALREGLYRASYPEPGLPRGLRRALGRSDTLGSLVDALRMRAAIAAPGQLSVPLLAPRPLRAARSTRLLTPLEAAQTLAIYAEQLGASARAGAVRAFGVTSHAELAPVGMHDAIVRVVHGDTVDWMDPGCTVCDGFEVRPDLVDQPVLGLDRERTMPGPWNLGPPAPDATTWGPFSVTDDLWTLPRRGHGAGSLSVHDEGETRTVSLQGVEALQLRRHLHTLPESERQTWLEDVFAPGAELRTSKGLASAGATVQLTFSSAPPIAILHGRGFAPGVSVRTHTRPRQGERDDQCRTDRFIWTQRVGGDTVTEQILWLTRSPDDADLAVLSTCQGLALSAP